MHGPGLPPQHGPHGPRPGSGSVVTLRVLFALLPVLTCGFFAWGTMLRLALVTRKARDWALLAASGVLSVVWITLIEFDPTENTDGWQGNLGAGGAIFTGFAICVYFLVADIKHHENGGAASRAVSAQAQWYPPAAPYTPPPRPAADPYAPPRQATPGYGYPPAQTPPPARPPVPGPPQVTPPPRIGQVRAELDELSELLRQQPRPPQPGGPYKDPNQTAIQDPDQ